MAKKNISESITENLFRNYYDPLTFIEKSAIPEEHGFKSKNNTDFKGYPDFFKDEENFVIVVEAKATNQKQAIAEVKHYMLNNNIDKDIIGIAISGQDLADIEVDYFLKNESKCIHIDCDNVMLNLTNIDKLFRENKYGPMATTEHLTKTIKSLNQSFNTNNKVRDTERSLFFSGLMIALKDNTFRATYRNIEKPSREETEQQQITILEAHNLNKSVIEAITRQLEGKINNLSKEYSWRDKFSFIKNIDYSIIEYKKIISTIEDQVFKPFQNNEKLDILGRAYKIFLSRTGKIDNKNIILTPDHIKSLMVDLARLNTNDVIIDTCTGTGGFLMEAMQNMIVKANHNEEIISSIKEKQLIGFEVDSVLFSLACSNMFLHGDGRTNLLFRSSLLNDESEGIVNNKNKDLLEYIRKIKPTKCIINPPYEANSSIKFTSQAIDYLESNGKLIIIMPTPTLTKNQGGLTDKLLKKAKLDFVIKMPLKLFNEQKRTVNTSVFGFTKTPHDEKDSVLFYNLDDDGFVSIQHKGRVDKFGGWNKIRDNIIDSVFNSNEDGSICEKRMIYKDGMLNCAGFQNPSNLDSAMVAIEDLFEIKKGTLASDKSEDGDFNFITGSDEWKKHSDYAEEKEALVYVVSAGGSLGKSHYVDGKFTASNLCLILTPKDPKNYPIDLKFYNTFLNSIRKQVVDDLADGTSKLTIGKDSFEKYYINYISIDNQKKFVRDKINRYEEQKQEMKILISESEKNIVKGLEDLL